MNKRACLNGKGQAKRRYAERRDAKRALRFMKSTGNWEPGTGVYRCPICDYFHIGHYPTTDKGRRRMRNRHRKETFNEQPDPQIG